MFWTQRLKLKLPPWPPPKKKKKENSNCSKMAKCSSRKVKNIKTMCNKYYKNWINYLILLLSTRGAGVNLFFSYSRVDAGEKWPNHVQMITTSFYLSGHSWCKVSVSFQWMQKREETWSWRQLKTWEDPSPSSTRTSSASATSELFSSSLSWKIR